MEVAGDSDRTTVEVFDAFTSPDTDGAAFDVTHVPVGLATYGEENLISRSQARRVLARCNLFRCVMLDFRGVTTIGRAFADEMFRVFPLEHPDVELVPLHALGPKALPRSGPNRTAGLRRARNGLLSRSWRRLAIRRRGWLRPRPLSDTGRRLIALLD